MSSKELSQRQIAVESTSLINNLAKTGLLLSRTFESVSQALKIGNGYAVVFRGEVVAYTECEEYENYHILRSVCSSETSRGGRHGILAVVNRLKLCWRRAPEKEVMLVCAPELVKWYKRLGFYVKPKEEAPNCVRGSRTQTQWDNCDRVWMVCSKLSYDYQKEIGTMAKLNVFVKVSGDLLEKPEVLDWLKDMGKIYSLVICVGGGKQISEAFKQNNYAISFGLLGRVTKTFAERQLARDVLELNQAMVQDSCDDLDISARVIIPVEDIGGVICPINGDIMLLAVYNGYDKIFILTEKGNAKKKQDWLAEMTTALRFIGKGDLSKIEVIGF